MDVASLGLGIRNEQVDQATRSLTAFAKSASDAERAAQRVGTSTDGAGRSSEAFTRRVQRQIETLQYQAQQLSRSSAEQERYQALRRAGVTAESAAGDAVSQFVQRLQEERAAQEQAAEAARQAAEAVRAAQQQAAEAARLEQQRGEAIRKVTDELAFESAQLDRTAAEQERYAALRRAGVDAESEAGRAITTSVTSLQAQRAARQQATEATRQAAEADRMAQQQAAQTARSTAAVVDSLSFERAQLGRTATERAQYDALRRAGVTASSAEGKAIMATVAALELERAALARAEAARLGAAKVPAANRPMTAQQKLVLSYQLNDIFTSVVGGMNPAMIAAQQGPQITQIFGGLKNTIAAIPTPALVGLGAALAGIAGVAALNAIARMNDELDELQRRLMTLLGSRSEAAKAWQDISRFASATGISIDAATESFVAFARAGQSVGATRQDIADLAAEAEKLAQLSGASPSENAAVKGALGDMLKDSTVSAEQLKAVLSNVPRIADQIARGLGVSVTQLRLMAAAGEIGNRQVFDALLKQSAAVNAEFSRMPKSIGGQFQSLADDMLQVVQRFANLIPLVNDYRVAIDLAARAAKALNETTTPATPQQRFDTTLSRIDSSDRLRTGNVLLGTNGYARDYTSAQYDQGVSDNASTFAQIAAQAKAANDNVVNAMAIADKLSPLSKQFRDSRRDIEDMEKALADLQSGLTGLSTDEAARQMGVLENAINRAKTAAQGIDPALKALDDIDQRNQFRANDDTPAGMTVQQRTQNLVASGSNPQDAQTAALAEQQEKIADIIKAKQQEADAEEKVTAATGRGKKALIEAQVEAATLNFIMQNIGRSTEGFADQIKAYADAFRTVLTQQAAQQSIDASKPLITELSGIAAAYEKVTYGAYAMARARAEAVAARDENGTGPLQLQVFDANQLLADSQAVVSLKLQVDLTNKLAAAAGDVAEQKKIQLDHDIMLARSAALPTSGPSIEEQMRAKAAADSALAYGNIIAQSKEFVAQQEVEQQAAFMGAEGAAQLRNEYQLLNQVRQAGIEQTPDVIAGIQAAAAAMAEAQTKAQRYADLVNLGKSTVTGFFSDMRDGLQQGASVWDAFGTAARNALNKIADKLLQMAVDDLFSQAFGGKGSSGAGFLGGIFSSLFGGGMSSGAAGVGTNLTTVAGVVNAKGNAFDSGNVIPFARGGVFDRGVVDRPTLFPMANGGTGLMGEGGPEAILPLRRGADGRLGVTVRGDRDLAVMRDAATPPMNLRVSIDIGASDALTRIGVMSRPPANEDVPLLVDRASGSGLDPLNAGGLPTFDRKNIGQGFDTGSIRRDLDLRDTAAQPVNVGIGLGSNAADAFTRIGDLMSRTPANDIADHGLLRRLASRGRAPELPPMVDGRNSFPGERRDDPVPPRFNRSTRSGADAATGSGDVYVNIVNNTDSNVSAKKSTTSNGQLQVDILVEAVEGKMSSRLSRGQGALGKTMEGTYGLQRVGR